MKPAVTVCIPAYNAAPYLRQAIESVLAQSFPNFELIVGDNASVDETFAIASDYAQKDARIRVFRNDTNIGPIANFNRCIDLARGEWIKLLCSDDWLEPTFLERMYAMRRDDAMVMTCVERYVFEQGMSQSDQAAHLKYWSDHCSLISRRFGAGFIAPGEFAALMAEDPTFNSISLNSAMVHRIAFDRFGRFNPELLTLDDWEFFARVAVRTGVVNVAEELANCRIHTKSYGSTTHAKHPFKMDVLSPLIIRHEVAYSPVYSRVQKAARDRGINLRYQLYEAAREALVAAHTYSGERRPPDPHAFDDWGKMLKCYPSILVAPRRYYLAKARQRTSRLLRRAAATLRALHT